VSKFIDKQVAAEKIEDPRIALVEFNQSEETAS